YRESLILWDLTKKQVRHELADAADNTCLAFSRDDRTLVSATGRNITNSVVTYKNIKLWDATTGRERATLAADSGWGICFVGFSQDERELITSGVGAIRVWSIATGQRRASLAARLSNAAKGVSLSPAGSHLAVADSASEQIVLWDIARSEVRRLYGA